MSGVLSQVKGSLLINLTSGRRAMVEENTGCLLWMIAQIIVGVIS
jgi:hypothetical protein